MRKIISSIDIGSNSVKLIVGEFIDNRLHILSASKTDTKGIENGKIIDETLVINTIKEVIGNASNMLGLEIKKVVLGINTFNTKLIKSAGVIKIKKEDSIIDGTDIAEVIQKSADGKVDDGYILIGVLPVEFVIDGERVTKDPKGLISKNLGIKSIIITSPKDYVFSLISAVEKSGIKVIDITSNALGDYYAFANKTTDESIGAVINLGHETTSISIFNRGILTNTKTYKIGGENIIKDISFVNKIDDSAAKALYKDLTLATTKLANPNDYRIITNLNGKDVKINQYELSEIAYIRLEEILNLAKKQINILTKKEISYIIITGGLTELRDFGIANETILGKRNFLGNLDLIGARDNSYATTVGILKYFDKKVTLRGKTFSIFSNNDIEELNNEENKARTNNSLLSKVFGYFFDS